MQDLVELVQDPTNQARLRLFIFILKLLVLLLAYMQRHTTSQTATVHSPSIVQTQCWENQYHAHDVVEHNQQTIKNCKHLQWSHGTNGRREKSYSRGDLAMVDDGSASQHFNNDKIATTYSSQKHSSSSIRKGHCSNFFRRSVLIF